MSTLNCVCGRGWKGSFVQLRVDQRPMALSTGREPRKYFIAPVIAPYASVDLSIDIHGLY